MILHMQLAVTVLLIVAVVDTHVCTARTIQIPQPSSSLCPSKTNIRHTKVHSSTFYLSASLLISPSCKSSARSTQFTYTKARISRISQEPKLLKSEILNIIPSTVCPCRITLSAVNRDPLHYVHIGLY
jgi:peroxiredoxin